MSSFNNVTKIRYNDQSDEPVTLNEYIVFQDDKSKRKYIVFRFSNNVTQQLLGMQFEVCQYNVDDNLIEKSVVVYNQFLAGAEEEFVPKAKLRVSYNCTSISVRLIQAAFDRFVWKEGEYADNTYKFGMFYNDSTKPQDEKESDKSKKLKTNKSKREKPEKRKKTKNPFSLKDATTGNLAKLPKVFNVLVIIAVLVFVSVTLVLFKKDTKKFTDGDYLVRITADGDAAVYGYLGDETNLVIPDKIAGYPVAKIDGGAFKNSDVVSVTFNSEVKIDDGAFVNCTKLTWVISKYKITTLGDDAFQNCPKLVNKP
ncbi:MAG: leucine-rich repeat domain-containing protein [Clostridia bacterium]|nr:leucine-rich repeat domain-containing protein [Clostridia bacterium]